MASLRFLHGYSGLPAFFILQFHEVPLASAALFQGEQFPGERTRRLAAPLRPQFALVSQAFFVIHGHGDGLDLATKAVPTSALATVYYRFKACA
jgi:hypothetical protein